jgi:hypothetical protein
MQAFLHYYIEMLVVLVGKHAVHMIAGSCCTVTVVPASCAWPLRDEAAAAAAASVQALRRLTDLRLERIPALLELC